MNAPVIDLDDFRARELTHLSILAVQEKHFIEVKFERASRLRRLSEMRHALARMKAAP